MRQRLIYILKHNALIQKVYRLVMSFVFKVCGFCIPVDENLVLFVSFMGKGFNDSPRAIYNYLKSHSEYEKYRCVWAFECPEKFPELDTVKIDTLQYFFIALKAKYWVTNTNIERGLTFKKKCQVYLNTWHGIALKKIGNDCPGRKDYNFGTVDYLCVSGTYDEKVFKSAFNAQEKSFLRCGMPRNDMLWNTNNNERERVRSELKIPEGKQVILYAPTWRESVDGGKTYTIKPSIDFKKWKDRLGDKYIVLFRAHHLTTKVLNVKFDDFIFDVSNYESVNKLMIVSDVLITDYSAIAFDYSILCKPIFCFAYDYETYLTQRGTYFEIDEKYPNKSCRDENELIERIVGIDYQEECENTRKFRDRYVEYHENATEECVKKLFESRRKH